MCYNSMGQSHRLLNLQDQGEKEGRYFWPPFFQEYQSCNSTCWLNDKLVTKTQHSPPPSSKRAAFFFEEIKQRLSGAQFLHPMHQR